MRVLAEWDRDQSAGYRALTKALDESGVEPLDTDLLEWGAYMGLTESAVFDAASNVLERALSGGEFKPRTRGWKRAQAEVMRRFLTTPVHSLDERTPQVAVWEERQEFWAERPGRPLRQAFINDVGSEIRCLPEPPEGVRDRLLPLLRIFEVAGAKAQLTQAGYLPPATVRALTREFGWWHWEAEPRSEADVPQIMTLKKFARDAGFIRKARGRLPAPPRIDGPPLLR
jgi:hypothetical protein